MKRKMCSKCENYKPLRDFNRYKDGYQSYCRICQEEYRLVTKYNITREQRDALYHLQYGTCAICEEAYYKLKTDYCYGIGVLNFLCPSCMYIVNVFQRDPLILQKAIDYLTYFTYSELPQFPGLVEPCEVPQGAIMSLVEYDEGLNDFSEMLMKDEKRNYGSRSSSCGALSRERKYGITQETYDYWLTLSEHTCYICRSRCKTGKALAVDHVHENGKIRGLLCVRCNTGLGVSKDNVELLDTCISYLESYIIPYIAYYIPITDCIIDEAISEEEACMRACDYFLQNTMI